MEETVEDRPPSRVGKRSEDRFLLGAEIGDL